MRRTSLFISTVSATLCLISAFILSGLVPLQPAKAAFPERPVTAPSGHPHDAPSRQAQAITPNVTGLLQYFGGPTMQSTSTTYAIFWEPPTLQDGIATYVSPTYNDLMQRYFNDIGDSGLYNNNTQYYDTTGHIINNSTLGGIWVDTSPYPPSICTDADTPHGCVNDAQLQAEVLNAMSVNGWSGGINHAFFVFTAWGEGSCHGDCAFTNFCAYHDYFTSNGQPILYANIPYMGTDLPGCGTKTSPNNDIDADSTIDFLSHEHMEMVTDPLGNAWHDLGNNEVGDRCGAKFGSVSLDGGLANEQWNGHYYIVQEEWSNALPGCVLSRSVSGTVYVGSDDSNLYALNANDGTLSWGKQTGNSVFSSPTVASDIVYVGSTDGSVYAFNAGNNSLLWQYQTKAAIYSSPTVKKGVVYIGSYDGFLYALNATTGALIWHFATGGPIASSPNVVSGIIYVGSNDSNLYAINATTGVQKWRFATGGAIASSPIVVKGVVYVGSNDGSVYAVNIKTGLLNWSYQTGSAIVHSSPAFAGGMIYIGSNNGVVYALNGTSGALVWTYQTGGTVFSSPRVVKGVLYVGSWDNYLYALDAANGTRLWRYLTGGPISSSPGVIDGIVYISSNDSNIYALWADDATLIWRYQTNGAAESSPTIVLTSY